MQSKARSGRRIALAVLSVLFCTNAYADLKNARPSLFELSSDWVDQEGKPFTFKDLAGKTTLVAMVYTSCQMACPLITRELGALLGKVAPAGRSDVRIRVFSFDPDRDTVSRLKSYAKKHELKSPTWSLLTGTEKGARELAVVLGIQYKRIGDGDFAHSNTITVLDPEGRIVHQQPEIGRGRDETVAAIQGLRTPKKTK